MNLVALADQDNLPNFQFIDKDTLHWIKNNEPKFVTSSFNLKNIEFAKNKVKKFSPPKAWFLKKEGIDSIHGMRHILRVIANVAYLIKEKGINDKYIITNALIAASLHDLKRKNDKTDKGHANRLVKWLFLNKNSILKHYEVDSDDTNIDTISMAILSHEREYRKVIADPKYKKNKIVVDLLKSGDALDRYRLPKLKWWINDNYLFIIPSEEAKLFAYMLVLESETIFLEKNDSVKSVLEAFDKFNKLKQLK